MKVFDWGRLTPADLAIARRYVPDLRAPDLIIDGGEGPYIYRWHAIERTPDANVYFHIQVSSDPVRPKHDHPWDNQTVMLAGAYIERMAVGIREVVCIRRKGDVVHRKATDAHRLELPPGVPYAMTQFSTGPIVRKWGYNFSSEWVAHDECGTRSADGVARFQYPERFKHLEKAS